MPSISQGSVATQLRCGGIFVDDLITDLLLSSKVKDVNTWPVFDEVVGESLVTPVYSVWPVLCTTL